MPVPHKYGPEFYINHGSRVVAAKVSLCRQIFHFHKHADSFMASSPILYENSNSACHQLVADISGPLNYGFA